MKTSMKALGKTLSIIVILLAVSAGAFLGFQKGYFIRQKKAVYEFVVAKKANIAEEVSVTGKTKPPHAVDLAFLQSEKVEAVNVSVGDEVKAGALLIKLDDTELTTELKQTYASLESAKAGLLQYSAMLEKERAQLNELKSGARKEEIQIAKTHVSNRKLALADVEASLKAAQEKADTDLANLYQGTADILRDALAKAEDAVYKQADDMFTNDNALDPLLSFVVSNSELKLYSERKRQSAGRAVAALRQSIAVLNQGMDEPKKLLVEIESLFAALTDALNNHIELSAATSATYKASVSTAKANLNSAISAINSHEQKISSQKAVNQSAITSAQASQNNAKSVLLTAKDELALKQASASEEAVLAKKAGVKAAEANVRVQEAKIKEAEAATQTRTARLAQLEIRSPISGTVTAREIEPGEIAAPHATVLSLIGRDALSIEAHVPEVDAAKIALKDKADIALDAYDGESFSAEVSNIDPSETVIEGVPTYKTMLKFIGEIDRRVKPGMTADISIITDKRENVIIIPQRAITAKDGKKIVRILIEQPKSRSVVVEKEVATGLYGSDGMLEITDGIREGDKVIVFTKEK